MKPTILSRCNGINTRGLRCGRWACLKRNMCGLHWEQEIEFNNKKRSLEFEPEDKYK